MIEANPRFHVRQNKICFSSFMSVIKYYPFKAWPRNLVSAISTTRNAACMYMHTPMQTAEIWAKYIVFLCPETLPS